jgi:hypothetical protein
MIFGPQGERCDELVCHKKIQFSGPKTSTVYLMNPEQHEVERIRVDGCAISTGKRCDWMARTKTNSPEELFIELKSAGRIQQAVTQIEPTINFLSSDIKNLRKRCLVVCTSIQIISTALQKYKAQFKKRYNARLIVVRHCQEIPLEG